MPPFHSNEGLKFSCHNGLNALLLSLEEETANFFTAVENFIKAELPNERARFGLIKSSLLMFQNGVQRLSLKLEVCKYLL